MCIQCRYQLHTFSNVFEITQVGDISPPVYDSIKHLLRYLSVDMLISADHGKFGPIAPGYHRPTKGVLSYLPSSCVPYAELMRLDKPIGTLNIYFPYLFGSLFAACARFPLISPLSVLSVNLKLFPMAFLLRSAGCTWNDLIDRDLDRKVARCRLRPIARYAVSPKSGFIFYATQMLVWLAMLLQTDARTICYAFGGVLLGHLYPFAKRFTNYPQVVLGFALSWGMLVGCVRCFDFLSSFFEALLPFYEPNPDSQDTTYDPSVLADFHPPIRDAQRTKLT